MIKGIDGLLDKFGESPEIVVVDSQKESFYHVIELCRERNVGRPFNPECSRNFWVEFLYPDGWVNGNAHDARLKNKNTTMKKDVKTWGSDELS